MASQNGKKGNQEQVTGAEDTLSALADFDLDLAGMDGPENPLALGNEGETVRLDADDVPEEEEEEIDPVVEIGGQRFTITEPGLEEYHLFLNAVGEIGGRSQRIAKRLAQMVLFEADGAGADPLNNFWALLIALRPKDTMRLSSIAIFGADGYEDGLKWLQSLEKGQIKPSQLIKSLIIAFKLSEDLRESLKMLGLFRRGETKRVEPVAPEFGRDSISLVFDLLETVDLLLIGMESTVIQETALPLSEIRRWKWKRLKSAYENALRDKWQSFVSGIVQSEIATGRALQAAFSKQKLQPLPTWEKMRQKQGLTLFDDPKLLTAENLDPLTLALAGDDVDLEEMSPEYVERWRSYLETNRLKDWSDGGKAAETVLVVPDEITGELLPFEKGEPEEEVSPG